MKNKLIENVENHLVTLPKVKKDTGKWFVRLPGTQSVSIVTLSNILVRNFNNLKSLIFEVKKHFSHARQKRKISPKFGENGL